MPIHDWTRVDAGVFHDFHQRWIIAISNTLNDGLIDMPIFLTPDRYVNIPLEATYNEAWRGVPRRWRQVVEQAS